MRRARLYFIGVVFAANTWQLGCAPAYHAYPNGCVTYGYRAQPTPPFTFYRSCPTPWLRRHAAALSADGR